MSLHRHLWSTWGLPPTREIDHENGNGLDCRRENLRAATSTQNRVNQAPTSANRSGVRGVNWNKERGKWVAAIRRPAPVGRGKKVHLGYFDDLQVAAAAYRRAAQRIYGDFAWKGGVPSTKQ